MNTKVITRFAPSPTGYPHLGTAMYALLNYIYARQKGGKVIMRSEDTDPVRSKPEYEAGIIEDLRWLGIEADEFARQSERLEIYKKHIKQLIDSGHAYLSLEKEEGKNESREVVRFKNPNKVVTFTDMARGDISVDTTDLHDFVIARDINSPLYNFTVVVDDFEMGITHVIRGEDGLANTPRQVLILEAIGGERPVYAHFPFVLNKNREKMGKRNGAVAIRDYRNQGYLPEAVLNFCLLLVWHPKDDRELFTLPEMIMSFELERIGKSGAILDDAKLNWLNREYMNKLAPEELQDRALPFCATLSVEHFKKFLPLLLERIDKFSDIPILLGEEGLPHEASAKWGEFNFLLHKPTYTKELLLGKTGAIEGEIKKYLQYILEHGVEKENVWDYATREGRGKVLWPMRVALSGREKSPDPFTLALALGTPESLSRLQTAIDKL